ncbi:MAG: TonB-dependent receptor [Myxococcota bacterium]|nr:TonB-dependent receptor [Myxococcota bacterium]
MLWLVLSALAQADGQLLAVLFDARSHPISGQEVALEQGGEVRTLRTDETGILSTYLPAGDWIFRIGDWSKPFSIADGHQSEVVLRLEDAVQVLRWSEQNQEQTESKEIPTVPFTGSVRDQVGAPLEGARILLQGIEQEAVTDANGLFSLNVPMGNYNIACLKDGFVSRRFVAQEIGEEGLQLSLSLVPAGLTMEDFIVSVPRIKGSAASLLAQRQESSTVQDVLGSEQMSRSGDSNAASALKRVTGLTVVGGKYVFVRGLGERYSSSLLNGSTLPSPEPERRVIPLDLFPTNMLESLTIQKTFSPDRPAEFGGGVVSIQTKGVPEEEELRFQISMGHTVGSNLTDGTAGFQGELDFLGFGVQPRDLPDAVSTASQASSLEERDLFSDRGYTAEELERFGEQLENHWLTDTIRSRPDFGVNFSWGRGWRKGDVQYGLMASGLWKNSWNINEFDRKYFIVGSENELELSHVYRFNSLQNGVRLSGALAGVLEWGNTKIQTTTLLNRSSDFTTRIYEGLNRDVGADIRVTRVGWKERQLFFHQFRGEHLMGAFQLDWRYALSNASRDEPDRREFRYDLEPQTGVWYLSDRPEGNSLFFSTLGDWNHDVGLDLAYRMVDKKTDRVSVLKAGFSGMLRERTVDTRRFKYMHKGPLANAAEILSLEAQDIFTSNHIGNDGFQFEEVTRQTDNYSADQRILAAYAMGDFKLGERLSLLGGMRMEDSKQYVQTFALFAADDVPVEATLDDVDFLPGLTLTYDMGNDTEKDSMRLRLGYGRTLSRPDFRELSPATFNDVTGGRQVYGNPELRRALIDNVDLRWEWYFAPMQSISLGAFYKHFDAPIESIVVVSAQHSVTYQNADMAQNYGLEFEVRKSFDFVSLDDVYLSGNAAWIGSEVKLADNLGIQSSDTRPLQGQSPFVYNLQLSYEHPDNRANLAVLYNVFGPRITEVGALGAPDYMENPVHRLDCVGNIRFGDWTVVAKMQNILDWTSSTQIGPEIVDTIYDGRTFQLGIGWRPL